MKKIIKIESDRTDLQNFRFIDVFFEGSKIAQAAAIVDMDTFKVIPLDFALATRDEVQKAIKEVTGGKKTRFPNGYYSWRETHFEVAQYITMEITKDKPTGIVHERHEAGGHGGLYELADELTDEFENLYVGFEWDGRQFIDEIDEFCNTKLYRPDEKYTPLQ